MALFFDKPNRTHQPVRRLLTSYPKRYHIDPAFGIPEGQPMMVNDPVTGYIRPLISYEAADIATALANTVGHSTEYRRPNDQCGPVRIHACGLVEMILDAPLGVKEGDRFNPAVVGGVISNEYVVADPAGIYEAVKSEECGGCCAKSPCPDEFPDPVTVSPTAARTLSTQRIVLLKWGTCET